MLRNLTNYLKPKRKKFNFQFCRVLHFFVKNKNNFFYQIILFLFFEAKGNRFVFFDPKKKKKEILNEEFQRISIIL